jgi:hypothetical protein
VKQKKIQSSGENLFNGWLDKFLISVWINNEKKKKTPKKNENQMFYDVKIYPDYEMVT